MATSNNLFISSSPIVQKLMVKSGLILSAQSSLESLSARLYSTAEHLYLNRDYASLSQVADLLLTLPHEGARAAGLLYKARCLYNTDRNDARVFQLLESASRIDTALHTKARAIQSLGIVHQNRGEHAEAVKMYRAAQSSGDAVAFIRAGFQFSELRSSEGNHQSALDTLRLIRPAVEAIGKSTPHYLHLFANEVAFELLQTGRLAEARCFAQFAIASPLVRAYPEWLETARAIEQRAEAKAALNVRPAIQQVRGIPIKPKLRLVKKPRPRALPVFTRRTTGPGAIIGPEQPRSRPTLEQISFKVQIRAPSCQASLVDPQFA